MAVSGVDDQHVPPGPQVLQQNLASTSATDVGAVPAGMTSMYVYRVRGYGCDGAFCAKLYEGNQRLRFELSLFAERHCLRWRARKVHRIGGRITSPGNYEYLVPLRS